MISGILYTIFVILKNCLNLFCPTRQDLYSQVPSNVFNQNDEELKEKEREKIRNKRLEFLKKKMQVSDQFNMENKLAKQLGLQQTLNQLDNDNQNENQNDNDDQDEDISLSDDDDDDNDGQGYTADDE